MIRALILVDIQNDFMPTGALPVPKGDEIIPIINKLQKHFNLIIATQDWHPANHGSFASNHPDHKPGDVIMLDGLSQVLWPDHCVQNNHGAEFASAFDRHIVDKIFHKGTDPLIDSYSGFFDNAHRKATGLDRYLKEHSISEVYIAGLATDYCVKYSVLDALHLGLKTYVIADACRGVNLKPNDSAEAFEEMKKAGAIIINSQSLEKNHG